MSKRLIMHDPSRPDKLRKYELRYETRQAIHVFLYTKSVYFYRKFKTLINQGKSVEVYMLGGYKRDRIF